MDVLSLGIAAVERGLAPDELIRVAIRRMCRSRLRELQCHGTAATACAQEEFFRSLRASPIAPAPEKANEQHYELPPDFFEQILGPRRKYSCCYWQNERQTLAEAEEAALAVTCERAELQPGQQVLELGCGWGSLSIWMAERYPTSHITAVSNSSQQRRYIQCQAAARGLNNLRVLTADMNDFVPTADGAFSASYDRVVSVEMFEHMRNYEQLLARIASWLRPDGELFVHVFCHRGLSYPFNVAGSDNWMGRYFFSGGIMPSADLLHKFDRDLRVCDEWSWDGQHYQRTAEAWLENFDNRRTAALEILRATYGRANAARWLRRWRVFFLAVSELFGYADGQEWYVAQYRLRPVAQAR